MEKAVSRCGNDYRQTNSEQIKITTGAHFPSVSETNTTILEGETSFKQQVLLTSQAAEVNAIQEGNSPTVASRLAGLRAIIQERAVSDDAGPGDAGVSSVENRVDDHELPPSRFVLQVLESARGYLDFSILVRSGALIVR